MTRPKGRRPQPQDQMHTNPIPPALLVTHPITHDERWLFVLEGAPIKIQKPHHHDIVFWHAVHALETFNHVHDPRRTLQQMADPLCIEALSLAPSLLSPQGHTSPAVHLLTRHKLFIKIQLMVVFGQQQADLNQGKVMVGNGDHWEPFEEWLQIVPSSRLSLTGATGYKMQYDWWKQTGQTGQTFGFNRLPQELKNQLLLTCLGRRVQVDLVDDVKRLDDYQRPTSKAVIFFLRTLTAADEFDPSDVNLPDPVNSSLLGLCKDLREQGLKLLKEEAVKVFRKTWVFRRGSFDRIAAHMPESAFKLLRRLEFTHKHDSYFELFGVPVTARALETRVHSGDREFRHYDETPRASFLKRLPNLIELELYFPPPMAPGDNPWHTGGHCDEAERYRLMEWKEYPCQRTVVDWIMTYAYEHIHHIKTVLLTGTVKSDSKRYWESVLREPEVYWPIIVEEKLRIAELHGSELTLKCYCPMHCLRIPDYGHIKKYEGGHKYQNATIENAEIAKADAQYVFDKDDTMVPAPRKFPPFDEWYNTREWVLNEDDGLYHEIGR